MCQKGIIYLIQPLLLVGTNKYKLGCSYSPTLKRCITGYIKGSRYISIHECNDPLIVEKILIKKFNLLFKLAGGKENFEGDESHMSMVILETIIEYKKNNITNNTTNNTTNDTTNNTTNNNTTNNTINDTSTNTTNNNTTNDTTNDTTNNTSTNTTNNTTNKRRNKLKNNNSKNNNSNYKCNICKSNYSSYQSLWNHNHIKHTTETSNITQTTTNVTQNTIKLNKNSLCIYCNKCFSRNDSLKRHQLKCNKKIEDDLYKKQIEKLTDGFEKLKHKINKKSTNKIINYNNNNTVNNTVNNKLTNINNIGTEKITDLTRDEKKYIMSHGMNSIISLAEHLNFNERLPQNHNFYVSALNDKHLNAIDNNTHTIVKQRKKEIFDQILVAHVDKLEKINTNIHYKDFSNVLTKLKNFIFLKQGKKEYFSQYYTMHFQIAILLDWFEDLPDGI